MDEYKLIKCKSNIPNFKISSSEEASNLIRKYLFKDINIYESMYVLYLNRNNVCVGWYQLSKGGVSGTIFDIKLVCKYAISSLSSSVILLHNHPSGQLNPSGEDIKITNKSKKALNFFDIKVLDHLIITANSYYSFADNGLL